MTSFPPICSGSSRKEFFLYGRIPALKSVFGSYVKSGVGRLWGWACILCSFLRINEANYCIGSGCSSDLADCGNLRWFSLSSERLSFKGKRHSPEWANGTVGIGSSLARQQHFGFPGLPGGLERHD